MSVLGDVSAGVIGQPFHRMRCRQAAKTLLAAGEHEVLDQHPQQADAPSPKEPASGDAGCSPEMPAAVADQAMISRSQASIANRMRTISPLRQVSSKWSEHQRMSEVRATTTPSCVWPA